MWIIRTSANNKDIDHDRFSFFASFMEKYGLGIIKLFGDELLFALF